MNEKAKSLYVSYFQIEHPFKYLYKDKMKTSPLKFKEGLASEKMD